MLRLAREKAEAIWALHTDLPVLAADTTVVIDDEILGKPESEAEAHAMLGKLSGRDHMVHTGGRALVGRTPDVVPHLDPGVLRAADDAKKSTPTGNAASRAARRARTQSRGSAPFSSPEYPGRYTGVMGLPLFETAHLLRQAGIPVWGGKLPAKVEGAE